MSKIEKEFYKKAIIRGGLSFFRPCDALNVIERCHQLNKKILGIDAFIVKGKKYQPVMEQSIDYSDENYLKYQKSLNIDGGHWAEAKEFIQDRINTEYVFEIVYEDNDHVS